MTREQRERRIGRLVLELVDVIFEDSIEDDEPKKPVIDDVTRARARALLVNIGHTPRKRTP